MREMRRWRTTHSIVEAASQRQKPNSVLFCLAFLSFYVRERARKRDVAAPFPWTLLLLLLLHHRLIVSLSHSRSKNLRQRRPPPRSFGSGMPPSTMFPPEPEIYCHNEEAGLGCGILLSSVSLLFPVRFFSFSAIFLSSPSYPFLSSRGPSSPLPLLSRLFPASPFSYIRPLSDLSESFLSLRANSNFFSRDKTTDRDTGGIISAYIRNRTVS